MPAAVALQDVGIRFDLDRQLRPVTPALTRLRRKCSHEWALRHINLAFNAGESVALVGPNGAGKTTLLRTIAGVLTPDEGNLCVRGRIGSLLSIEAGLMPTLTGRENAMLLGTLSGLPRTRVRGALAEIERVSGLGAAFDHPVSTYSQGMMARLGFAVVEQADPDVLLLDEVHEAIDESFRTELELRVGQIRRRGGIIIAAGHDHLMLGRLCDQTIVLDHDGPRRAGRLGPRMRPGLEVNA
jgi:ABC-type polysaccharide/polyol phosphate transport system ATPase subunit